MTAALKPDEIAAIVFIDIAIIMVATRLVGTLFRRIRQPAVVGEIIAGIVLGPTLLGALRGDLPDTLFPGDVRPFLKVLAQLGLVIFMFIVGLELDLKLIRGKRAASPPRSRWRRSSLPVRARHRACRFVLHGSHGTVPRRGEVRCPFALFIGASMSITAFPVLARILTERGMHRTTLGALTLACAAVDDIIAWSLLAVVLAVVESGRHLGPSPRILVESIVFVGVMFVVVRPRCERAGRGATARRPADPGHPGRRPRRLPGLGLHHSKIGIHSIFGAFLFGVVMPREDTATSCSTRSSSGSSRSACSCCCRCSSSSPGSTSTFGGSAPTRLGGSPLILLVACAGKFVGAAGGRPGAGHRRARKAAPSAC